MIELFDSHAHLDVQEFKDDQDSMIERARNVGVNRIVTIGAADKYSSAERAIKLTEKYPGVWASIGLHPHDAEAMPDVELLHKLSQNKKVVAIGETGLDFFRDWSPKDHQEICFIEQIRLALTVKKPLIIHSREAGMECFKLLNKYHAGDIGGVFHCYAEDADFAKRLADINFKVSFPGTLTFKKTENIRVIARDIPISQIMIETDSPYMAPEPYRGKRCEPAFILETAKVLATVKGLSLEETAKVTTQTAKEFFKVN